MNLKKTFACCAVALATLAGTSQAETLKASHQFPGGKGDVRDEMVQLIAREVAAADVDLTIRVYPWQFFIQGQRTVGSADKGAP